MNIDQRDPQTFVRSFSRGLDVIRALGSMNGSMALSEVAGAADLSPSVTRRLLSTLVELGYVQQRGKEFLLLPKTLDLGAAYLLSNSWTKLIQPQLSMATERLQMTTAAGVLDGPDVVHIVRSPAPGLMHFNFHIGQRFPAHATALGRVLLAGLDQAELDSFISTYPRARFTSQTKNEEEMLRTELEKVREQGYAVVNQELQAGLISIAVPIRARSNKVAAAINVTTYDGRLNFEEKSPEILTILNAVSAEVGPFIP